jgi:hypothetical protein
MSIAREDSYQDIITAQSQHLQSLIYLVSAQLYMRYLQQNMAETASTPRALDTHSVDSKTCVAAWFLNCACHGKSWSGMLIHSGKVQQLTAPVAATVTGAP